MLLFTKRILENRHSRQLEQSLDEIIMENKTEHYKEIQSNIQVMRLQEENAYGCNRDYLFEMQNHDVDLLKRRHRNQKYLSLASQPVDKECRFKMAEWSYQVIDFCKFKRETVAIAMSYLDRYLLTKEGSRTILPNRKKFQLASLVVLYIAVKLHEPKAMEASVLSTLSHGMYTEEDIYEMESSILKALQWRLNPPTSLAFVRLFLELVPESALENQNVRNLILEHAKFQTELAVNEYDFVTVKASSIAFAAISNAFSGIDPKDFALEKQKEYLRHIANVGSIHTPPNNNNNNIIDKDCSSNHNKISANNADGQILYDPPLQNLNLAMEKLSHITCETLTSLGCSTASSFFVMSPRTTILLNKNKTMEEERDKHSCIQSSPRCISKNLDRKEVVESQ